MVMQNLRWFLAIVMMFCSMLHLKLLAQTSGKLPQIRISENEIVIKFFPEEVRSLPDSLFQAYGIDAKEIIDAVKNSEWTVFVEAGWSVKNRGKKGIEMRKSLQPVAEFKNPSGDWFYNSIFMTDKQPGIPIMEGVLGYNEWKNSPGVTQEDSLLRFELQGFENAAEVFLSGSFNNWNTGELKMQREGNNWVFTTKLAPGKYLYKYVVDGKWMPDPQNMVKEEDGYNDYNSVLFVCNYTFRFKSDKAVRKVFLAGTFNDWYSKGIRLVKRNDYEFELPVYLVNGTYAYKFVADGNWFEDPDSGRKVDDNNGGFNSIVEIGNPFTFKLDGFLDAKSVFVAGSFNNWQNGELAMSKSNSGWYLDYVLAPGNYEYKFIVDDAWMADPQNPLTMQDGSGNLNSLLFFEPNYTFILKDYELAKQVVLSGSFNNWNESAYQMERMNGEWVFHLFLSPGRYKYKFIVDGLWINDPANQLWEENEYGTGNSVLWFNPSLMK